MESVPDILAEHGTGTENPESIRWDILPGVLSYS